MPDEFQAASRAALGSVRGLVSSGNRRFREVSPGAVHLLRSLRCPGLLRRGRFRVGRAQFEPPDDR